MGTEYTINYQSNKVLDIEEQSNRLDVDAFDVNSKSYVTLFYEAEPSTVIKTLLNAVKVCSYWMTKEEFEQILRENPFDYST